VLFGLIVLLVVVVIVVIVVISDFSFGCIGACE